MAEAVVHIHSTRDPAGSPEMSWVVEAVLEVVPPVEAAVKDAAAEEAGLAAEQVQGHLDLGLP